MPSNTIPKDPKILVPSSLSSFSIVWCLVFKIVFFSRFFLSILGSKGHAASIIKHETFALLIIIDFGLCSLVWIGKSQSLGGFRLRYSLFLSSSSLTYVLQQLQLWLHGTGYFVPCCVLLLHIFLVFLVLLFSVFNLRSSLAVPSKVFLSFGSVFQQVPKFDMHAVFHTYHFHARFIWSLGV